MVSRTLRMAAAAQRKTPPAWRSPMLSSARRIPVNVATPTRFGGCDARQKAYARGRCAGGKAAAVRASDRPGDQQLGGVPAGRDQSPDGHQVAVRSFGPQYRRGGRALSGGEDLRAEAAQPAVSVAAGTDRDRRPARGWRDDPHDRARAGTLTVDGQSRDSPQQRP